MKNRMLGVIVPILAGAALIGTGFSTWYFTTNGTAEVSGIATNIAKAYNINGLTLLANGDSKIETSSDTFFLQMDSTIEGDASNNGEVGINLVKTSGTRTIVKNIDAQYVLDSQGEFGISAKQVTLKVTVEFTGVNGEGEKASNYIALADEWTSDQSNTWTYQSRNQNAVNGGTFAVPKFGFAYVKNEGVGPKSMEEWTNMNNALEGASVSITYSLDWAK